MFTRRNWHNKRSLESCPMKLKKYFQSVFSKTPSEEGKPHHRRRDKSPSGHFQHSPHQLNSPIKHHRKRKLWLLFGIVSLFVLISFFATAVYAQVPIIQEVIAKFIPPPKPGPITQSKTVLPSSAQSSIEDLAKQQIQKQEANATLPGSANTANPISTTTSVVEPLIANIQIALTFDPVSKAKLRIKKIDRLVAQLQNILASDRSANAINQAVGIVQAIGVETGKVTGDPKVQGDRNVLALIIQQYNRVQIALQTVEDTLPMNSYLKVEEARVKYVLKPAQESLNNAPNLEVVNTVGVAEAKKIVGAEFAELKSIEILTDLSGGLSSGTQAKLVPIQKELAAGFEKRMLKLPPNVRQRKLDDYMNFSHGNPIAQVKAFDQMQNFLTDRQIILGVHNLKEIALQKLSDQISETNDPALDSQFLDTVIKNPKDLEVVIQMQLQKDNPKLESAITKKTVNIFGKDSEVFKTAFAGETAENATLLDVALTNYLQKTLGNDPSVAPAVKALATELKRSVLGNFTQNVNGEGFNTTAKLAYNPVNQNADIRILIPNPGGVALLDSLKINNATLAAKSILSERLLSGTINPQVFNGYAPLLNGVLPAAKLEKVKAQVASTQKAENQKLFETIQQLTQAIFITGNKTSIEKLLPDNVQQEIAQVKSELPARNIPQLSLPEGVTLPEVAKLPSDVNNAIITAAQDKINEQKKPADLKLNLENLAKDLGVSVPVILPDSPLYLVVEAVRTVELVATFDPIARAELLLKQDNEKTIEAAKLIENNQSVESVDLALKTLSSVNDDFNKLKEHTAEIVKLNQTEPQKVDTLVSQIVDNGLARQTVFSEIENKVHGDTYVVIEEVRTQVLTKGIDTLLTLTNNDVVGLVEKLETAINKEQGGTLSDIKAVELLNEIARTETEETQKILQEAEAKIAQNLETKILAIAEDKRTETVLAYAANASGNPVREIEAYEVLKDSFKNPETILLAEGMKGEVITNLTNRITEITDAATQTIFVDKIVGNEPQDLKVALEVEVNVAPLQTTDVTVAEVLPIVQKVGDMKAAIEQNIIDVYKDKPAELAKADFFDNPTLSKTPDVLDIQVVQNLQQALDRSSEVIPQVVQVAKDERTKIVDTFIQNVSNPAFQKTTNGLAAETLNPVPETLAALILLKDQVTPAEQTKIDIAISVQVELMQTYLTTQVADPIVFETYVNQIAQDPAVAQLVQEVGGQSFQKAIAATSQTLEKQAEADHAQLVSTVAEVEKQIFTSSVSNPSAIEQTLPQRVQTEIQQLKEELPVTQIPTVTVEVTVQAPASTPVPTTEPSPVPTSVPVSAPTIQATPVQTAPAVPGL